MHFRIWLESNFDPSHVADDYETLAADWAYNILEKAIHEFFRHKQSGKIKKLTRILLDLTGQDESSIFNGKIYVKIPQQIGHAKLDPSTQAAQKSGVQLRLTPTQHTITGAQLLSGSYLDISLNVSPLIRGNDFNDQEVQLMLKRLRIQINHEIGHVHSCQVNFTEPMKHYITQSARAVEGDAASTAKFVEGMIHYYVDPGELRAHARQYAAMYSYKYPGEQFDINKLAKVNDRAGKLPRFIWGLSDPIAYQHYWKEGNITPDLQPYVQQMQTAYKNFYLLMQYFVNQRVRLAKHTL